MQNHMKKIRQNKKLTLTDLSELTKLSRGYLSHLDKGSRASPSLKTIEKITKALDCKVFDIYNI